MSGKSVQSPAEILQIAADELTYIPSPEERKAKSSFWAKFSENPVCEPEDITLAMALQYAQDGRLRKWWGRPGFQDWFRNRDEFRQRMEFLAHLAMDAIETVLIDPHAQGSAKVNAAKLVFEVSRKIPSRAAQEKYIDEKINEMSKAELEAFIQKRMRALPPATPQLPQQQEQDSETK